MGPSSLISLLHRPPCPILSGHLFWTGFTPTKWILPPRLSSSSQILILVSLSSPPSWIVLSQHTPIDAGYGLFATVDLLPNTPLFTVPASALISIKTLSPHYPHAISKLSAVQLISLHLSLHRPQASDISDDPLFGPYISVMPRDFDFHPFTWFLKQSNKSLFTLKDTIQSRVLQFLPSSITRDLSEMADRFFLDWDKTYFYLNEHADKLNLSELASSGTEAFTQENFLWAWLCVNTRCIYHRLKSSRSDPDNLILCPVLDFANHAPRPPFTVPLSSHSDIWDAAPVSRLGESFTLMSPEAVTVTKDSELYLRYGAHPNKLLYTEYGFVNAFTREGILNGTDHGEVDVQDVLERLIDKLELGSWIKEILEEEGYWGDWTMQCSPYPAHPSYRLITALRLSNMFGPSTTSLPADAEHLVDEWRKTTLGIRENISRENENAWRATLLGICETLSNEARQAMAKLNSRDFDAPAAAGSIGELRDNTKVLWEEQLYVAEAVALSIKSGVEF